ncbi:MAG: hypothetical protein Q9224_004068, partial [Gallowayella concinna]
MLAQAHFLQTNSEPKLYYKPWELLPGEDSKIKSQLEEADQVIQREAAEFDPTTGDDSTESQQLEKPPSPDSKIQSGLPADTTKETVGPRTDGPQEPNSNTNDETTDQNANNAPPETQHVSSNQNVTSKEQEDDGDEMVEADEDM